MIKLALGILLNITGVLIIWGRLKILHWGYGKTWVKLGQILGDDRVGQGLSLLTVIGSLLMAAGCVLLYFSLRKKADRAA